MCKILPRLKDIADHEGITIGALERAIGASKGVISRAIANGTDIQSKWIQAIVENYPQYSPAWLLTGEGDMLKTKRSADSDSTLHESKIDKKEVISQETRPRIPFDAAAGSLSIALGSVSESDCERLPLIPILPRYDFTIIARGESMEPQYMSGDELACLFIKESSFIQWGRTHVLDTAQGIVVKRIYDHGTSITCKSNNPDYPDFDIPKEDIYRIALVVGYLRIE
ncbi:MULTISPECIES: S24 family peptidase [Bacteroidales]|uniref:S24 family peptidase n=1 Tax=Bacteroidales TaxID=171549 RepID=UPI001F3339C6|nr:MULTISPECIES: S24 family peptidase [Bacteroidales]